MVTRERRKVVGAAVALALLVSVVLGAATGMATTDHEMLVNGNFEGGFATQEGCGLVGKGWGCFTNGGSAAYGFYDDLWAPVVADGAHSQLIEINTLHVAASESDRFAGIFQPVKLTSGATYTLKVSGLMRERNPDPNDEKYRFRVQWGYTADGSTDWTKVTNWVELPWDKIDDRTAPTSLESFTTQFAAPSGKITLFFRAWKKWGTAYRELDINLDAISLVGKAPITTLPDKIVPTKPAPGEPAGCTSANLVANGSFETGFNGGVGAGWVSFTNGGSAAYGFYDEMWAPVVKDGKHGQLIEINTWGLAASEPDRHAGIYQVVGGLSKNATYALSIAGMIREEASHADEDQFRYRVQWGYAATDADPSQSDITNWVDLPWDTVYPRTAPGGMSSFTATFQAPSDRIVIGFRALKKWGEVERELNVNLDAIKLEGCATPSPVACHHVVKRGDRLGVIASSHGTTVAYLAKLNHLPNASLIFVGQKLKVPCGVEPLPAPPVVNPVPPPAEGYRCTYHIVMRGEGIYRIAEMYGVPPAQVIEANRLLNPSIIFTGQKLCIPW